MSEHRWHPNVSRGRKEQRPYTQCPHCQEWQYTRIRDVRTKGSLLLAVLGVKEMETVVKREFHYCHNCHYEEPIDTE